MTIQYKIMTIWPPDPSALGRPAYRAIAQAAAEAVAAGELAPGTRLPTHRALAFQLGVSVQTISRAYEELARLGLLSGEVGRGSFVRIPAAGARMPWHRLDGAVGEVIDLSMLTPVTDDFHRRRFSETLAAIAADPPDPVLFSFRPNATLKGHCTEAARWLAHCGMTVSADHILPTNGSTAAMTIALMAAAAPGDLVAVEEMTHHTLKALASALGLRVIAVGMDEEGLLPEALDRACAAAPVKAVYLIPEGAGPLACRMGPARRQDLIDVARARNLSIIENDALGPLAEGRGPPIGALAPERTFYFTGLTKCCLPGLRIAWLVAPERSATTARTRHLVTNWMATALMAEIASRWLADGNAMELLRWQRAVLEKRNQMAAQILSGHRLGQTATGLHVWLSLCAPWEETSFVALARHAGVAIAGGSAFAISDKSVRLGVRICLGGVHEHQLARGLETVARLANSEPGPIHLAY